MKELPRISIITPSYNQGRFIERTIRSVLEQDYPDIEYIVVDGGSTDETIGLLKKYEGRLRWISEKDRGQADAINKGIKMSTGEILAYLNSDDVYEKGALRKVADCFSAQPSVKWLTGRCRIINEEDSEIRRPITAYKNFLLDHYGYNLLLVTNPISQPATFWRKDVVGEFGYFDIEEHLVMDYEYWLRIGRKYHPAVLDDYLAGFRVHKAMKTSSTNFGNFRQELIVSRKYSKSLFLYGLHYASYLCIYFSYEFLALIGRLRKK